MEIVLLTYALGFVCVAIGFYSITQGLSALPSVPATPTAHQAPFGLAKIASTLAAVVKLVDCVVDFVKDL